MLAPLLMMGGALGGIEAMFLPNEGVGFWPLVSMGAILGGTMRSPFTGIVFALELTHDVNMLLPLLVAVVIAHGFTVLTLRRSILTEKVARRGYHLSREYARIRWRSCSCAKSCAPTWSRCRRSATLGEARELVHHNSRPQGQHLFPVVDGEKDLLGVITRKELFRRFDEVRDIASVVRLADLASSEPVVAFADEPLRVVVHRMAETGLTRMPVLDPQSDRRLVGMISLHDLLHARTQNLAEERTRERVLRIRIPFGRQASASAVDRSRDTGED